MFIGAIVKNKTAYKQILCKQIFEIFKPYVRKHVNLVVKL